MAPPSPYLPGAPIQLQPLSFTWLDGHAIETEVEAVRVDGRWYLADYLEDAEASLPPPEPEAPAALAKEPKAPAGR